MLLPDQLQLPLRAALQQRPFLGQAAQQRGAQLAQRRLLLALQGGLRAFQLRRVRVAQAQAQRLQLQRRHGLRGERCWGGRGARPGVGGLDVHIPENREAGLPGRTWGLWKLRAAENAQRCGCCGKPWSWLKNLTTERPCDPQFRSLLLVSRGAVFG